MKGSGLAMVFVQANQPLHETVLSLPQLKERELLVKIKYCSICASDLHTYHGRRPGSSPSVLGHEIVGEVYQTFNNEQLIDYTGKLIKEGDLITWSLAVSCGECLFCQKGFPQKCEKLLKYGHQKQNPDFKFNGGFAEFIHLQKGTTLFKLNPALPTQYLSALNCSFATVAAALRNAGQVRNRTTVIFGAGMLGIIATAMLKQRGASTIYVIDPNEYRLDIARKFGATETIRWDNQDAIAEKFKKINLPIDLVFETSGSSSAVSLSTKILGIGGRLLLCGSVFPSADIVISPEKIVRNLWQIIGIHNYHHDDLLTAICFFEEQHTVLPFELLFHKDIFSLGDTQQALEMAKNSKIHRVTINCSK